MPYYLMFTYLSTYLPTFLPTYLLKADAGVFARDAVEHLGAKAKAKAKPHVFIPLRPAALWKILLRAGWLVGW